MEIVLFFALAIAYALLCRWIAEFANSKGWSYWGFALFSFFATPIWGFILALLAPERHGSHRAPQRNAPA
jgi:hypothetical protein